MKREELKKTIDSLWSTSKKDVDKILESTSDLVKEGERYIKDKSEQGKKRLEIFTLNLRREKLYYELGKAIAKIPKNKWTTSPKIQELLSKSKSINIMIGKNKKK